MFPSNFFLVFAERKLEAALLRLDRRGKIMDLRTLPMALPAPGGLVGADDIWLRHWRCILLRSIYLSFFRVYLCCGVSLHSLGWDASSHRKPRLFSAYEA